MTRHAHRLAPWQRHALYATGALLMASGVVWLAVHYSVGGGSGSDALPHPIEAWAMRLHGLASYGGLFMLGVIGGAHVPQGWRLTARHRWAHQRASGVMLCSLGALMVFTGYLLYYFAPESIRPALGWAHASVGLVTALLLLSHRRGA
jgi:hypothetical protein